MQTEQKRSENSLCPRLSTSFHRKKQHFTSAELVVLQLSSIFAVQYLQSLPDFLSPASTQRRQNQHSPAVQYTRIFAHPINARHSTLRLLTSSLQYFLSWCCSVSHRRLFRDVRAHSANRTCMGRHVSTLEY